MSGWKEVMRFTREMLQAAYSAALKYPMGAGGFWACRRRNHVVCGVPVTDDLDARGVYCWPVVAAARAGGYDVGSQAVRYGLLYELEKLLGFVYGGTGDFSYSYVLSNSPKKIAAKIKELLWFAPHVLVLSARGFICVLTVVGVTVAAASTATGDCCYAIVKRSC